LPITTYSDVKNVTVSDPSKHVMSVKPAFLGATDYHLMPSMANDTAWTGDDGTQIGAFGGKYAADWSNGIGAK